MAEKHKNVSANSDIVIDQFILISPKHAHWHVNEDPAPEGELARVRPRGTHLSAH